MYQAIVNTNVDFIGVHFKDCKAGLKFELNSMFETIHNEVEAAIWDGQYDIEKRNVEINGFRTIFLTIGGSRKW